MTEFKCAYCGHEVPMTRDLARDMVVPYIDIDEEVIDYEAGTVRVIGSYMCSECGEQTEIVIECKIEDILVMKFEDFQEEYQ